MKIFRLMSIGLAATCMFTACDDTTSDVGNSLVSDQVEIVQDSSFTITGRPVENSTIMSRTLTQLLGVIDADNYGSLRSDIVTQFMSAQALDTIGVKPSDVDSVKLLLFLPTGAFTGDSLAPMGLKVYRLNKQLPNPIYSTFDPETYFSPSDLMGETIYSANALYNDTLNAQEYRRITVDLPRQFGVDLYNEYLSNPATLQTPSAFAKWFPGVYIANSFGKGRVVQISETRVNVYYTRHEVYTTDTSSVDTTYNNVRSYLAVTPEVITNNNIRYNIAPSLKKRIDDGETIIVSPTGTDVEFTFPINDMIEKYRREAGELSVFNTMELEIPVETIENVNGINPPQYLLMILSKKKDEFFANNELTDSRTSFYATYNSTKKRYTFSGLRQYFIDMLAKDSKIEPEDYTFTLTPIELTMTQTSQYSDPSVTAITPYVLGPTMVKLNIDAAKIRTVYSRQNINF